ncbi:xanthine dehydrogenase [Desmospora sp. 8437]|nr:xanthine dehydrogenase [Desmospora sp. 8437]
MSGIHRIFQEIRHSDDPCVLATVIGVEGSAYRKEGAVMLWKGDGSRIGLLSGGCLEEDVALRAEEAFKEGSSRTVLYNLRSTDDLSWGQGAGCDGAVHVLLEPVHPRLRRHLCKVGDYMEQGVAVTAVKKLTPDRSVTDYLFIPRGGQESFGEWQGQISEEWMFDGRKSGISRGAGESEEVFVHHLQPKPRLILIGAGEDAEPLARFAARTGFSVVVADWRPARCNKGFFPDADRFLVGFPEELVNRLAWRGDEFVVIMTHQFERDRELLHLLRDKKLSYLGILGPRRRTSRLLAGRSLPEGIRSPVGLPIGAEGPEEIAVSILADLIRIRRQAPEPEVLLP